MPFSNPIVGGTTLIRPAIHSPDYVAGSSGWSINKDGSAEFNDVTIRGDGNGDALVVGPDNGPQVQVGSTASAGYIQFPTNRPIENDVATILAGVLNQGAANEAASLQIFGPTVDGATDQARILLNSQNNDGSSQANASLVTGSGSLIMDENALTINGPRIVVQPSSSANTAMGLTLSGTHTGSLVNVVKGAKSVFFIPNDGRLLLSPDASANSAIFVNADAGHTGNLLRLSENSVDAFRVANNGDTIVAGQVTAASASFTNSCDADAMSVTGNLNAGSVNTDSLTAGNIQKGLVSVTTIANQWVEVTITFPQAFASTPVVVASPNNNAPAVGGTTQLWEAVTTITTTGCVLRVFRSTAITMNFGWIAIA